MSCEPTLQRWVSGLLAAVGLVQEEPKEVTKPAAEGESPDPSEQQVGRLAEHTKNGMDTLRLCIKHVVFDAEAARRENACLRKMLAQCMEKDGET